MMEVPPFLKNYLLAMCDLDFLPFFIPTLIFSPAYIIWMCYLGSFCVHLVSSEKEEDEGVAEDDDDNTF